MGVRQQVQHHLLHAEWIGEHDGRLVGVAQHDGAVRVLFAELLHEAAQYMVQRDRLEIHDEPARLDQRDIEHVVHDPLQTLGLAQHDPVVLLALLGGVVHGALDEAGEETPERCQRRAELVGDHRDEVALDLLRLHLLAGVANHDDPGGRCPLVVADRARAEAKLLL